LCEVLEHLEVGLGKSRLAQQGVDDERAKTRPLEYQRGGHCGFEWPYARFPKFSVSFRFCVRECILDCFRIGVDFSSFCNEGPSCSSLARFQRQVENGWSKT